MELDKANRSLKLFGYTVIDDVAANEIENWANRFGRIVVDKRNPELIRDIRPRPANLSNSNTLSSRYGMDSFPFHTDCAHWAIPAHYLLLYCENPGRGNRKTLLIDTRNWSLTEEAEETLKSGVWKTGLKTPHLCTVLDEVENRNVFRFDEDCMAPVTMSAKGFLPDLRSIIQESARIAINWKAERMLIIDNHRMLHARGASDIVDSDRILKRILISEL